MEKRKVEPRLRAVVFDLDGTLADTLTDIAAAVNATLVASGREPHPLDSYRAMVGRGLKQLLVTASANHPFSEAELEQAYQKVLAGYRAQPVVGTVAYEGVGDLLGGLDGRVALGVFSNKEDGLTKSIVGLLFPGIRFSHVVGARPGQPHKPHPGALLAMLEEWGVAPEECAYLGDSDVDMETATLAGVVACGAAWGFRGEDELRAAGAFEVFDHALAFALWLEPRINLDKPEHRIETEGGAKP